ncbi:MAG: cysteine--tRNA ligase [Candidatus Micrarchaeota archaeon]
MLGVKNTLSTKIEELAPAEGDTLQMYVCGITPYDSSHLGHARTFCSFDIMRRWMQFGHKMKINFIQNVTDVDDKIIKRAQERGMAPLKLSDMYDKQCREEMKMLNILPPTHMPKISGHMPQTIAMIEKLIKNGIAYTTDTGVYYEVSKFPGYGKLSRQDPEGIRAGARIEIDEKKKNPADFALWKFEESEGCTWDSPWGRGRPGWHIECSAMSMHYTGGKPLDLHCGARDLIFPHHENEIAQGEGAGYKPFSRMWMHTGFLTVSGEKMSKSLGNFITVAQALKEWGDANILRLFFAQSHYSSPVDYSPKALEAAKNTLENVKRSLSIMQGEGENSNKDEEHTLTDSINSHLGKFSSSMDNDFDTPTALSELVLASKDIAKARAENKVSREVLQAQAQRIASELEIFGIEISGEKEGDKMDERKIKELIEERENARQNRDFKRSDEMRKLLAGKGVLVEDSKDGVKWRYA